jgi:hypothetical protein
LFTTWNASIIVASLSLSTGNGIAYVALVLKTLQFTVPNDLHSRLKEEAHKRRDTLSNTLRAVLDESLPPDQGERQPSGSTVPQANP